MNHRFALISGLTAAALGLSVAGAAVAQISEPPGGPPPPPPGYQGGAPAATPADQSDRLRQALGLRPDQEGALQAFIAAMAPKPGEAERFRAEAERDQSLPTPQKLDRMVAHMDVMRAEVLARINATKLFYGQLTPGQQRAFDSLPAPGQGASRGARPPGSE